MRKLETLCTISSAQSCKGMEMSSMPKLDCTLELPQPQCWLAADLIDQAMQCDTAHQYCCSLTVQKLLMASDKKAISHHIPKLLCLTCVKDTFSGFPPAVLTSAIQQGSNLASLAQLTLLSSTTRICRNRCQDFCKAQGRICR